MHIVASSELAFGYALYFTIISYQRSQIKTEKENIRDQAPQDDMKHTEFMLVKKTARGGATCSSDPVRTASQ